MDTSVVAWNYSRNYFHIFIESLYLSGGYCFWDIDFRISFVLIQYLFAIFYVRVWTFRTYSNWIGAQFLYPCLDFCRYSNWIQSQFLYTCLNFWTYSYSIWSFDQSSVDASDAISRSFRVSLSRHLHIPISPFSIDPNSSKTFLFPSLSTQHRRPIHHWRQAPCEATQHL